MSQAQQGSSLVRTTSMRQPEPVSSKPKEPSQPRIVIKRAEQLVSTIHQDEELKRQLKYAPELAAACKDWIEGFFLKFILFLNFLQVLQEKQLLQIQNLRIGLKMV